MKRILVIAAIAASCLAIAQLTAQTEVPRMARLGLLSDYEKFGPPADPTDWLESFRAGLRELGYVEGKNIVLEFRYANRDPEKLAHMAAELAAMKMDVIVAASTTAAKAAKAATHNVPIVFWGAEPISSGLVHDLDHPGENLTGITFNEAEQREFLVQLKEVVPDLKRIAILFNRSYAPVPGILKYAEIGARELGLSSQLLEVAAPSDLPEAFAAMKRAGSRAVLVLNHRMFFEEGAKVAALAIENGVAVSTPYLPNAEAGALIAHVADFDQVWRINAGYVDKILKGAKPGDLPVRRLEAFRYAINLKTAKALGLTIPDSILKRAASVVPDSASVPATPGADCAAFSVSPIKLAAGEWDISFVDRGKPSTRAPFQPDGEKGRQYPGVSVVTYAVKKRILMVPYISTSVCDHAGVLRYYYLVPLTVYALEKNHHTYAYIANAQLLGEPRFGARVIGAKSVWNLLKTKLEFLTPSSSGRRRLSSPRPSSRHHLLGNFA